MTIETIMNLVKDNFPNLETSSSYGLGNVHYYVGEKEHWMEERDNFGLTFQVRNNELYLVGEYASVHHWDDENKYGENFNLKIRKDFVIELIQKWISNIDKNNRHHHKISFYTFLKNHNLIRKFAGRK